MILCQVNYLQRSGRAARSLIWVNRVLCVLIKTRRVRTGNPSGYKSPYTRTELLPPATKQCMRVTAMPPLWNRFVTRHRNAVVTHCSIDARVKHWTHTHTYTHFSCQKGGIFNCPSNSWSSSCVYLSTFGCVLRRRLTVVRFIKIVLPSAPARCSTV